MLACFIQLENIYNTCDRGQMCPSLSSSWFDQEVGGFEVNAPAPWHDATTTVLDRLHSIHMLASSEAKAFGPARVASSKFQVKLEDFFGP